MLLLDMQRSPFQYKKSILEARKWRTLGDKRRPDIHLVKISNPYWNIWFKEPCYTLPILNHLRTMWRTCTLSCWYTILHSYAFRVFHLFSLLPLFRFIMNDSPSVNVISSIAQVHNSIAECFIWYETMGAFVISEEAIASFSTPVAALICKRKTINSI